MKKRLFCRDDGILDQILPVFVGIIMLTIVFGLMLGTMDSIQTKNQVDMAARRAILLLETYGYIEDSMKAELVEQLEQEKVKNVSIETRGYSRETNTWGTVNASSPASYGQKVEVVVTGSAETLMGNVLGNTVFSAVFQEQDMVFKAVRVSTSKN